MLCLQLFVAHVPFGATESDRSKYTCLKHRRYGNIPPTPEGFWDPRIADAPDTPDLDDWKFETVVHIHIISEKNKSIRTPIKFLHNSGPIPVCWCIDSQPTHASGYQNATPHSASRSENSGMFVKIHSSI